MNYEDYNADSICRSLGLSSFIDSRWSGEKSSALRIVLKPSFDPEVVFTLTTDNRWGLMSVVAAKNRIWASKLSSSIKIFEDSFSIKESDFLQFVRAFDEALMESKIPNKRVTLDGMAIEACSLIDSRIEKFGDHVSTNGAVFEFVVRLIKYAWEACGHPEVKNAVLSVAGYVNLSFPKIEVPATPSKPRVNILVLGTPEGRSSHFNQMEERRKQGNS
jgi:hypothetical protein